jgi:serine/threonine-protein kinase HipA
MANRRSKSAKSSKSSQLPESTYSPKNADISLFLDVRLDGFENPAGQLLKKENGALQFVYNENFLARPDASPISLSLGLTEEPYGDVVTRAFFDNLLQEREDALRAVMDREAISRDDIAGLLCHLGKDCAGALSVLPAGSPPTKVPGFLDRDYSVVDDDRLAAIIRALHDRKPLPEGTTDPSPLAGVQTKVALTRLPDGRFAEPLPDTGAPTTHIIKVPDHQNLSDPKLEAESLRLAALLGFETAIAETLQIGGIDVLCVTRFDRNIDEKGKITRLHQEDFAQALGLPPSLKYERRGEPGRRFDTAAIRRVLDATINPAGEREIFIAATFFDLLIGNCDAHAKNHGLLYVGSNRVLTSPRYDILPTRLDDALTDEFPYRIGLAKRLQELTIEDVDAFLAELGISSKAARSRVRNKHARALASGLATMLEELADNGMKSFADLIASNIRHFMTVLKLQIPPKAKSRDAFIRVGGGWTIAS